MATFIPVTRKESHFKKAGGGSKNSIIEPQLSPENIAAIREDIRKKGVDPILQKQLAGTRAASQIPELNDPAYSRESVQQKQQQNKQQDQKDKQEQQQQQQQEKQNANQEQQQEKKEQQSQGEKKKKISQEEAERILEALKENQEKMKKKKVQTQGKARVDKDW